MIDKIWEKYDTDKSGELDYKETKRYVKDIIGHIPEEVVLQVFTIFDKDGSGTIGKEEMIEFMKMINDETESPTKIMRDIREIEDEEKLLNMANLSEKV